MTAEVGQFVFVCKRHGRFVIASPVIIMANNEPRMVVGCEGGFPQTKPAAKEPFGGTDALDDVADTAAPHGGDLLPYDEGARL